jgi:lipid-A-disaccharide synthase
MTSHTCMFIAGDPSGDQHAAPIINRLQIIRNDVTFIGIGGPAMQRSGFQTLLPFEQFNRMGFFEVLLHLPFFLKAKKIIISWLSKNKPDCLVCVDYSGFNIPIMKAASKLGIPVIWYIAPMVWAWKKKRAEILAKYASHICCIFPFEVQYFKPFTEHVSFVGNPTVEDLSNKKILEQKKMALPANPHIALLPGSRMQEISRVIPAMVGAYKLLKEKYPSISGTISRYNTLDNKLFFDAIAGTDINLFSGPLSEILTTTDIAIVTSGTATLETALMGIPHVIVYKTSPITYLLAKHFIVVSHIGLPNIIAQETIAPELIQQYVTERSIFDEVNKFFLDSEYYHKTAYNLFNLKETLGAKTPSLSVADSINRLLK